MSEVSKRIHRVVNQKEDQRKRETKKTGVVRIEGDTERERRRENLLLLLPLSEPGGTPEEDGHTLRQKVQSPSGDERSTFSPRCVKR